MGKRTRRRVRTQSASGGPLVNDQDHAQQMARVNVDLDTWTSFRVAALRRHTSVAAYLGELVVRELNRTRSRQHDASVDALESSLGSVDQPS